MSDRSIPTTCSYTKDHEWARVEGKNGHHRHHPVRRRASSATSPRSTCPKEGETAQAGRGFGTVESVKAVSDLFAPRHRQGAQGEQPARRLARVRQQDPYDERLDDPGRARRTPRSSTKLMDAAAYEALLAGAGRVAGGASLAIDLTPPDVFVRRHIGPGRRRIARDAARARPWPSLDELIDETVPASIRCAARSSSAAARTEARAARRARARSPRRTRSSGRSSAWATHDTHHPAGHPAQHPGEPRLVHAVHAVPGGDRPGPARGAAQLPDDGRRPDRPARSRTRRCSTRRPPPPRRWQMCTRSHGERRAPTRSSSRDDCHPQTIAVVRTRAEPLGIELRRRRPRRRFDFDDAASSACCVQYPTTDGAHRRLPRVHRAAHAAGALVVVAADLLALTLLTPPGEFGADIAVGSAQRFGVPLGFGGPHAAFMATSTEYARKHARPHHRRLEGRPRQARLPPGAADPRAAHPPREGDEQHLHRAGAAGGHGQHVRRLPRARRAEGHRRARARADRDPARAGLDALGHHGRRTARSSTRCASTAARSQRARCSPPRERSGMNLRALDATALGIALDETTTARRRRRRCSQVFAGKAPARRRRLEATAAERRSAERPRCAASPTTSRTRSSTRTTPRPRCCATSRSSRRRDLSLTHSMIPLGSCTMKLNATAEMIPVTWPEFGTLHPFAPRRPGRRATSGSSRELEKMARRDHRLRRRLAAAQRRLAGRIRRPARHPRVPRDRAARRTATSASSRSAHGTNPARAVMAGYQGRRRSRCDEHGNVDVADLAAKAAEHTRRPRRADGHLPVHPRRLRGGHQARSAQIVHEHGGQVYMDGANMNAQVGLCRPGDIGADVCHLNLHKTFCIPHGGGGPGMGPIGVAAHLAPFLPGHPVVETRRRARPSARSPPRPGAAPASSSSPGSTSR